MKIRNLNPYEHYDEFLFINRNRNRNRNISTIIDYLYHIGEIHENFDYDKWLFILEFTLLCKYGEIKKEDIKSIKQNNDIGFLVEINKKYTDKWLDNLYSISFDNFIPFLMVKNIYQYKYNYLNFDEVYKEITSYYRDLNKEDNRRLILKKFINYTYGMFLSKHDFISCSGNLTNEIVYESRYILKDIIEKYKDNIIYVDTDIIYMINIENKLGDIINFLKEYRCKYSIIPYKGGLFLGKKKYLVQDINNNIKIVGIR